MGIWGNVWHTAAVNKGPATAQTVVHQPTTNYQHKNRSTGVQKYVQRLKRGGVPPCWGNAVPGRRYGNRTGVGGKVHQHAKCHAKQSVSKIKLGHLRPSQPTNHQGVKGAWAQYVCRHVAPQPHCRGQVVNCSTVWHARATPAGGVGVGACKVVRYAR